MPVEGGARVAVIEGADRMNEDAQSALLKTLEEPPAGVVIVLCADQEDRLMPTVRSRCARVRLGLVGSRDIEAIVADHDLADPPLAARLGRLAGGRPGIALAYARAPDAVLIRAELSRVLLDLTGARPSARLAAVRAAIPRAIALSAALSAGEAALSANVAPRPWRLPVESAPPRPLPRRPRGRPPRTIGTTRPPTRPGRGRGGRSRLPSAAGPPSSCWRCGWRSLATWPSSGPVAAVPSTTRCCSMSWRRSRPRSRPGRGALPRTCRPVGRAARLERLAGADPRRPGAGLAAPRGGRLTRPRR